MDKYFIGKFHISEKVSDDGKTTKKYKSISFTETELGVLASGLKQSEDKTKEPRVFLNVSLGKNGEYMTIAFPSNMQIPLKKWERKY